MIRHCSPTEVLEDLRYALSVMEEESHLGLDNVYAETVRRTLLRQITAVEAGIARESAASNSPTSSAFEFSE